MPLTVPVIPAMPVQLRQRQDSLNDQIDSVDLWFRRLRDEHPDVLYSREPLVWALVANRLGCYDAADYYIRMNGVHREVPWDH